MAILDSQSMQGLIVIIIILWVFSAGGMKTIQKLIEEILEEL